MEVVGKTGCSEKSFSNLRLGRGVETPETLYLSDLPCKYGHFIAIFASSWWLWLVLVQNNKQTLFSMKKGVGTVASKMMGQKRFSPIKEFLFEKKNWLGGDFSGTKNILLPGRCSGKFCPLPKFIGPAPLFCTQEIVDYPLDYPFPPIINQRRKPCPNLYIGKKTIVRTVGKRPLCKTVLFRKIRTFFWHFQITDNFHIFINLKMKRRYGQMHFSGSLFHKVH